MHNSHLIARKLLVDLDAPPARHWNGGDAFRTAACNALSMSFPAGEAFFIESVRQCQDFLPVGATAPDLPGFIAQEATHRRIHERFNAHLYQCGQVNYWQNWIRWRIQFRQRWPVKDRYLSDLAVVVAYEHLTAVLSQRTLQTANQAGDWFAQAPYALQTLWRWHASEEIEHKSVAFDLYQQLGGSYAKRIGWYIYVLLIFGLEWSAQITVNLWHDKTLFRPSTWWSAFQLWVGKHGALWWSFEPLTRYLRRDFHPNQTADAALASQWLAQQSQAWAPVAPSQETL